MSDHFLYEFQKQPAEDFSRRLYERINPEKKLVHSVFVNLAYGFSSLLVGLFLLLAVSPTARVYAQEIVYNIGQWIISHQPTAAEQFERKLESGEIEAYEPSGDEVIEWQAPVWMSVEEAESLAGFKVFQLPLDGFDVEPFYREVQANTDAHTGTAIVTVYGLQEKNLVFRQTEIADEKALIELPVGEAEVQKVVIAEGEGYWIEDLRLSTYVNEENKVEPKYANVLIWEQAGFEFWLQCSPGLALEDMLSLAQGIK